MPNFLKYLFVCICYTVQPCIIDAIAEAGVKWTHVNGFSFVVGYKGLFNTKTSINELEGRLEWVF